MRILENQQLQLGQEDIANIRLDTKSRDDIPQLLRGLQHIYSSSEIREEVFQVLEEMIPDNVDRKNGRLGMHLWNIFVLGVLRLNLNWDYDRVHEMANNHKTIRQMLGHGLTDAKAEYKLQTLKDNISLMTPEILDRINQIVVKAGHRLVKKNANGKLRGRCDSFVVETNVHYPTDINLLFDSMRKVITLIAAICSKHELNDWRQSAYNLRKVKKLFRKAQKMKRSTSVKEEKKQEREQLIKKAHNTYLGLSRGCLFKVEQTFQKLIEGECVVEGDFIEIKGYMKHALRQIDQIKRRVIDGELIPHNEKVFSIFEEHTEWISKGKAGVPVELGLRACVVEDQYGFILHHQVMEGQTDDKIAVSIVKETIERYPSFALCSFDRGFYSPDNRKELGDVLETVVMPKKGRLSKADKEVEYSEGFLEARRQHCAVESAINALEVHGLDRCPDHGIKGFNRHVALAVVARNIQKLGVILRAKEKEDEKSLRRAA